MVSIKQIEESNIVMHEVVGCPDGFRLFRYSYCEKAGIFIAIFVSEDRERKRAFIGQEEEGILEEVRILEVLAPRRDGDVYYFLDKGMIFIYRVFAFTGLEQDALFLEVNMPENPRDETWNEFAKSFCPQLGLSCEIGFLEGHPGITNWRKA